MYTEIYVNDSGEYCARRKYKNHKIAASTQSSGVVKPSTIWNAIIQLLWHDRIFILKPAQPLVSFRSQKFLELKRFLTKRGSIFRERS